MGGQLCGLYLKIGRPVLSLKLCAYGNYHWHLTPWLTGAGARSAEGTDIGHENAEGMAYVGVRVEPTVRLGTEVEGGSRHESFDWDLRRTA